MAQKTEYADGVSSTGKAPQSELDGLADLAGAVDGEHLGAMPDGTPIADQPAPVDYGSEAAMTVDTIAAMIVGYCPPTATLWTDDKKAAVSAALAPVYEKYGFTLGGMPCELVLVIVAGPLLYQSSKLIAHQIATEKAAAVATKAPSVNTATGTRTTAPAQSPEVSRHPQTALYPVA